MNFNDLYETLAYEKDDDGNFKRVTLVGLDRSAYNSLRVQLVRKFSQQARDEAALDIDRFSGMYMACSFTVDGPRTNTDVESSPDSEFGAATNPVTRTAGAGKTGTATFQIKDEADKKRQCRTYTVAAIS